MAQEPVSGKARRAVLYARVSLGNGEQDPALQQAALRAAAEREGWQVMAELTDEAGSTNHRKRIAWKRALEIVKAGGADVLAVWRLDRAFRSVLDASSTLEMLRARKVRLVSVTEGFDKETIMGEAMFGMLAVFAQMERRVIVERTVAGMAAAARRGAKIGWPKGRSRKGQGVGRKRGVPVLAAG